MPALSNRTANFTDSVIRRMTRISNQYGAINLSQGFPDFAPPKAIYVLMDISELGYEDDNEFCVDLARKVGVGAVPGSSFFKEPINHLIRFHFAKQDETLLAALDRLSDIRTKLMK